MATVRALRTTALVLRTVRFRRQLCTAETTTVLRVKASPAAAKTASMVLTAEIAAAATARTPPTAPRTAGVPVPALVETDSATSGKTASIARWIANRDSSAGTAAVMACSSPSCVRKTAAADASSHVAVGWEVPRSATGTRCDRACCAIRHALQSKLARQKETRRARRRGAS